MLTYHVQRIFLEDITEYIVDKYYGPKEDEGLLFFTEPFPWWSEDQATLFYDDYNQDLFWKELRVSNWHDFKHSEGMKGYVHFIPLILQHILNLYQQNGYTFVSHAQGHSFYWGNYKQKYDTEEPRQPKGQEMTIVFSIQK